MELPSDLDNLNHAAQGKPCPTVVEKLIAFDKAFSLIVRAVTIPIGVLAPLCEKKDNRVYLYIYQLTTQATEYGVLDKDGNFQQIGVLTTVTPLEFWIERHKIIQQQSIYALPVATTDYAITEIIFRG